MATATSGTTKRPSWKATKTNGTAKGSKAKTRRKAAELPSGDYAEMLRGAQHYSDLTLAFEELGVIYLSPDPSIEGDSGERNDYVSADRILEQHVCAAFGIASMPAAARGFLRAWANDLLMVASGVGAGIGGDAKALLTDHGWRNALSQ